MAVIGKIRERGTLLGIIVGGALVLFVVGDFIGNRSGAQDRNVGSIAGNEVSVQAYSELVDRQVDLYRQNGTTVDDQLQQQVRNGVWNDLLRQFTLSEEAEKAGFGNTISREEYDDIRFGNNILPDFRNNQNFIDPATGQVSKEQLRKYFKYVQENNIPLYDMQKRTFVPQRIQAKYNDLVKKSCFVNSAQVRDEWAAKNTKADFQFVAQRLDAEPDSLHPVSDTELRRFYDAHKNDRKYRQTASRGFAYVRFNASPTQEDIDNARQDMMGLKTDFEQARGLKADSALVMAYADTKNPVPTAYQEGTADHLNDSLIIHADTGTVVGPYRDGNTWKLVKVARLADVEEARVRHILLTSQGEDAAVKQRADSILNVVKRDRSKFGELVEKFSDDPGSKSTGGVYEWFNRERMVPEFTKASFDEKVGAITVVKTSYGYHVVEVLGQRSRKERQVLTIDRKIAPVQAMKAAWKTANEFSLNHPDSASFRKAAEEQGLVYTPVTDLRPEQNFVPGLQDANEVVRWVNHAQPDAKSSEPLASGDSYVVCTLLAVREPGVPELADVREKFTTEVRKEKKAAAIAERMKGKTDLQALATELGTTVQNSGNMAFNANSLPGGYSDIRVVGSIFGLANGSTSAPIIGDMAVYVAHMNTLTPAGDMPEGAEDVKMLTDRVRNRAAGQVFNALKEAADVQDNRSQFY
ncbi:MAG: peptidylprolyl isomerase [Flavobacteriales bacterium]|nr:peptidylprolyl isomerase [Flavobacteriales bacterium]MCL4280747.1 peptidylprolyl isomerase [Flavobacteriales bacterium]